MFWYSPISENLLEQKDRDSSAKKKEEKMQSG
jgi:hypothetical protein